MDIKALDVAPKLIAIFTSLLIFCGIISSVVYYRAFSIDILDYISLSEIVLIFVSNFSMFIVSAILGILANRLYSAAPRKSITHTKKADERFGNIVGKLLSMSFFLLFLLPAIVGFSPIKIWSIALSVVVRLTLIFIIGNRLHKLYPEGKVWNIKISHFVTAGIALTIIATAAMTNAYLVYSNYSNKRVILFKENGDIIKSDSSLLYLGKSNEFYFLYEKLNDKAIVLRSNEFIRIEFEHVKK